MVAPQRHLPSSVTAVQSDLGELVHVIGPDGSTAAIAVHGAHVVSWRTADGTERLFLSSRAAAGPATAIRGGIPVCFPQFAALGPLPKHGFARTDTWTPAGDDRLTLDVTPDRWPGWPHACTLTLQALLGPDTLTTVLTVTNRGDTPLPFTGALHTYLAVDDIATVSASGLDQCGIHGGGRIDGDIRFGDGSTDVDLSVVAVTNPVMVRANGEPRVIVAETGFVDVVVWNVGAELGASMGDLGPGEWRRYVCVEAAVVESPVEVAAGATWTGSQTLVVP